ncbi:MAG TPA: sulfatase [Bryobacteraceae bacterium]|nr:sulfatase [Bryobacteraceae bacterium]
MKRRAFVAGIAPAILRGQSARRPNILLAIADDMSYEHTSAMGDPVVRTPAFDRVAEGGVLFRNAFAAAPGCAPSRAGLLTGRHIWTLEEAGTHASLFPRKFAVYPELLGKAGYFTGLTGKGAGPCNFKDAGWPHNPAGPSFDTMKETTAHEGMSALDYGANFGKFLQQKPKGSPFAFWFGCHEPHRIYKKGIGVASGKRIEKIVVPPYLPDTLEVRNDIADYLAEIEHFNLHLERMLDLLGKSGELDNTIVIVTADNGMSFPGSKATMKDYGWHVPMAIMAKGRFRGGRTSEDLVSFTDLAPTILEAAGVARPPGQNGRSLLPLLGSAKSGVIDPKFDAVYAGRERHSHARRDNLGYPTRALRTREYLYIRNFKPDRWMAGDPPAYRDIDDGPTKQWMMTHREDNAVKALFDSAFGKKPAVELYNVRRDPGCLQNLASDSAQAPLASELGARLDGELKRTKDPRVMGNGDVWDSYPRYSPMRPELGGFAKQGEYNPAFQK